MHTDTHWERLIEDGLTAGSVDLYREVMGRMECELVAYVLDYLGGDHARAAEVLGLSAERVRDLAERGSRPPRRSRPA